MSVPKSIKGIKLIIVANQLLSWRPARWGRERGRLFILRWLREKERKRERWPSETWRLSRIMPPLPNSSAWVTVHSTSTTCTKEECLTRQAGPQVQVTRTQGTKRRGEQGPVSVWGMWAFGRVGTKKVEPGALWQGYPLLIQLEADCLGVQWPNGGPCSGHKIYNHSYKQSQDHGCEILLVIVQCCHWWSVFKTAEGYEGWTATEVNRETFSLCCDSTAWLCRPLE